MTQRLVLGSTSPFRRALLERLGLVFEVCSPEVDEQRLPDESPEALVTRLAEAKARAAAERCGGGLVIGSDQVACLDGRVLGKPGGRAAAVEQLSACSGHSVLFLTGLCLYNADRNRAHTVCEPFRVHFRSLGIPAIERYVDAERPFNCAGSFKSEGLGITLFQRLEGDDPNALIGLPLIRLVAMLAQEGIVLP